MAEPGKPDPGKYDRLKTVLEKLEKPTAFELGVVRALHDIHRRVIEEPWFGRTVHDVVSYYNQRLGEEHEKEPAPAREPTQHNVQQNQQQNAQEKPQEHEHDYNPDVFFGRDKATTERQQERERQEQQRTQERGRDIER